MENIKNLTEENIVKITRWYQYVKEGKFGDSKDIVNTYNTVFDGIKHKQPYTSCGSCLRRLCTTMWNEFQAYQEAQKSLVEALDEVMEEVPTETDTEPKKRSKKA